MVTYQELKGMASSLPEVTEAPHFEKMAFKVAKKIFITINEKHNQASVKLSKNDQAIFSAPDANVVYPVPNKWGEQGWTIIELSRIDKRLLKAIIATAYCEVAPKKLKAEVEKTLE